MELFKKGPRLTTVTKFGAIEHFTSEIVKEEVKNFTFKEGYNEFVEQFYSKGLVVVGKNERAYILIKKDIYSGKTRELTGKDGFSVRLREWKKVSNLKAEFKAITRVDDLIAEFKFEEKKAV